LNKFKRQQFAKWTFFARRWFGLRLIEFRMVSRKAQIICLKRGYLSPYKSNLASYFWFVGVCVNHPVKIVKVFVQSFHQVKSDLKKWGESSDEVGK
jgi:hypothetical protein